MAVRASSKQAVPTLPSPAVFGLDAGRELARKQQRRRRRADRIKSGIIALIALGFVVLGGWVGWVVYEDQQRTDAQDREQRLTELERTGTGDDVRDALDELETNPKWNGPGNPTFGVGDDPAQP